MLRKVRNGKALSAFAFISFNETTMGQLTQKRINIDLLVREQHPLNFLGTIFQPPLAICDEPESDEQEARVRRTFGEIFVLEESWLNVS